MFLSYIIPLYNCERFLPRCLDSLLRQGLSDDAYEVVIINDGSTDRSREIAMEYCLRMSNFRLFDQPNSGVGAARNLGIDKALGKYVMFIDADDWLLDDGVRQLMSYVDTESLCDVYTFWSHTVDSKFDMSYREKIQPHKLLLRGTFKQHAEEIGFGWSSCMKIISRSLLNERGVKFSGHKVGEDLLFMSTLFDKAPDASITATSLNIYRYFVHPKSAVNRIDREYNLNVCRGYIEIFRCITALSTHELYCRQAYDSPLDDCRLKVFTRMISGASGIKDIRRVCADATDNGVFPVPAPSSRIHKFINIAIKNHCFLWMLSKFYQSIFLPYIKPRVGRN